MTHGIKEEGNIHAGGLREEDSGGRIITQGHVTLVGKYMYVVGRDPTSHSPWTTVDNHR